MRALIVEDGGQRSALAATRALGRAGWAVGDGSPYRGLASHSRYSEWHSVAVPRSGGDAFIDAVNAAIAVGGYELVFGAGDAEVLALSAGRAHVPARIPYARHEVMLRSLDKRELAMTAARVGLATPRLFEIEDLDGSFENPVVVKERTGKATVAAPVSIARTSTAALDAVERIRVAGGDPMVQELVHGPLVAYIAVRDQDGRIAAHAQQIAERIWPSDAGGSVRARTIPVDRGLADGAAALLADLDWFGLAQLQFILGPDGRHRLIDFNGRFYGSLALVVASGVNVAAIWAASATGRPGPRTTSAVTGQRYQVLQADLRRAWVERRGGLIRDIFDCVRFAPGATHSVLDRRDLGPACRLSLILLGRMGKRTVRRARGIAARAARAVADVGRRAPRAA